MFTPVSEQPGPRCQQWFPVCHIRRRDVAPASSVTNGTRADVRLMVRGSGPDAVKWTCVDQIAPNRDDTLQLHGANRPPGDLPMKRRAGYGDSPDSSLEHHHHDRWRNTTDDLQHHDGPRRPTVIERVTGGKEVPRFGKEGTSAQARKGWWSAHDRASGGERSTTDQSGCDRGRRKSHRCSSERDVHGRARERAFRARASRWPHAQELHPRAPRRPGRRRAVTVRPDPRADHVPASLT